MNAIRIVTLAFLATLIAPRARAADYYVAQAGQTPTDYTSWAGAASNIQEAVDAAALNDTVWVGPGRYTVPPNPTNYLGTNIVYLNKPLVLRSSNGVPASTIIDGEGLYRGIATYYKVYDNNPFVIDGFTISNCGGKGGILRTLQRRYAGCVRARAVQAFLQRKSSRHRT